MMTIRNNAMLEKIEHISNYIYIDAVDRVFVRSNKFDRLPVPTGGGWPISIYQSKDWPVSGIYYTAIHLASLNWNENLSKEETEEMLKDI